MDTFILAIQAIAFLCQVHGNESSSQQAELQLACQQEYVRCMSKNDIYSISVRLNQCILDKKR